MANYTLADMAKLQAVTGGDVVLESIRSAPELELLPVEFIPGATITIAVCTSNPTAAFRDANEGVARSVATFENRVFQCHNIDTQVAIDQAIADQYADPAAKARLFSAEAAVRMNAIMRLVSTQFYYGQAGGSAKGFPGLAEQYSADASHEVDAGGSTAKTSVWLMGFGPNVANLILANNRMIQMMDEWTIETVYDGSSNPYQAYTNWILGAVGFSLRNKNAAIRIKNVGTDSGKGLTDDLLADAVSKMEELGVTPTHILMNPRSKAQLKKSRTATTPRGVPAPMPSDYEGIPIITTTGLVNSES